MTDHPESKADLIRDMTTMSPDTPYAKLLKEEFGVEVPEGAPLYHAEYLYKYCLQCLIEEVPEDQIVAEAAKKVEALVARFPYIKTKYEDAVAVNEPKPAKSRKRIFIDDNTVTHVVRNNRYYFWLGGVVTVSAKTLPSLDKCLIRKYGSVPTYNVVVDESASKRKDKQ